MATMKVRNSSELLISLHKLLLYTLQSQQLWLNTRYKTPAAKVGCYSSTLVLCVCVCV